MIAVTAAIARASPNRFSQICAARAIGSKGSSSGLGTGICCTGQLLAYGMPVTAGPPRRAARLSDDLVTQRYIACLRAM